MSHVLHLHYSDGSIVTSDAVADALLRYAQGLADNDRSDVVRIPILDAHGDPAVSSMLIGPASQLHTTPWDGPDASLDDEAFLMELLSKADRLRHPPVVRPEEDGGAAHPEEWGATD